MLPPVHDNTLVDLQIIRTDGSASVVLRMTEYKTRIPVTLTFANTDWISANIIGLIAREPHVDYIRELSWSDVPTIYAANPHCCKFYVIGLGGGSSLKIVSPAPHIVRG